jgi:D-serine deaminase-like pyridoxal phosphate-dependent protein
MNLQELETPALVVDRSRMEANVFRMRKRMNELGVMLRPHVKTAKCLEAALACTGGKPAPITVSTLAEAEFFAARGFTDILYAVGLAPAKVAHVLDLHRRGIDLTVITDNVEMARLGGERARAAGIKLPLLVEIDSDGHRAGVRADDPLLIEVGRAAVQSGCELRGVMTHAGASYDCRSVGAIRAMAEQERARTVGAAERLRAAGLPAPVVSVGSTPTATYAERLDGVTEVRAGVFVFFDLVMAGISVCRTDDIALSVLASVTGHQREKGWVLVDAGWMAMSRDRGTAKQPVDQGYGLACTLDGKPLDGVIVSDIHQEHGILSHRSGDPKRMPDLPIGTLLRILPNHACATAAQFGEYHVVRGGSEIEARWRRLD